MKRRILIAIATYNELENLPDLISELHQQVPSADILVVDDNSPDGTPAWLRAEQASQPHLHFVIRAGKLGLGSAAKEAFQWGLDRGYHWIATMDADFSHSVSDLVLLLERAAESDEPDLVIGSRYVPGGRIEGWPWLRRLSSRWINRLARLCLRLKTFDNSGAFRVYRAEVLKKIDPQKISASGYVYLQEIMLLISRATQNIVEHPITFRDRVRGQTKINAFEAAKAVLKIISLGLRIG